MPFSRRTSGIVLSGVLAVIALGVGAFVLTQSGKASDVDLTTARLVPADAGAYFAVNTDLSASQWVAAFNLAGRMGQKDARKQLEESVTSSGVDWEDEVAPFLGGNAAFYFRSAGTNLSDFSGGAIVRCKDAVKCFKVLLEQSGDTKTPKQKRNGIEYVASGTGGFAARTGDHLVITSDEDALFEVLDVAAGKKASLASVARFQSLRDELSKNFLMFVYMNSGDLFGDTLTRDDAVRKAIQDSGAGGFLLEPVAAVIGAKDAGFEFQEAAVGKAGVVSPLLKPHESRFVKMTPADTAVFVSTNGLADAWDEAVKSAKKQIDEAIRESGEYRDLDDALAKAGAEIGLKSLKEMIDLLRGETAIAVWFPNEDQGSAEGVVMAEVQDEARARDVLKRVTASSKGRPDSEKAGGVEMTTVKSDKGDDIAYAVTDKMMIVGSRMGVRTVLEKKSKPLAELDSYQRTAREVPSGLGSFGYFNVATLVRLTTGGKIEPLDDAAAALDGLIINMVNEREIARFNGVLTVAKK